LLNTVRLNLLTQAFVCGIAVQRAKGHVVKTCFELFDLVLVHATPFERLEGSMAVKDGLKLVPKWSMPFRVTHVFSGGQRAICRSLLSSKEREVHISQVRFIGEPRTDTQRKVWQDVLEQELQKWGGVRHEDLIAIEDAASNIGPHWTEAALHKGWKGRLMGQKAGIVV